MRNETWPLEKALRCGEQFSPHQVRGTTRLSKSRCRARSSVSASDKAGPLSPHTSGGLPSPSWFGFRHRRLCTLSARSDLASVVQEPGRPRGARRLQVHLIQVRAETPPPPHPAGARPGVLSLMAPVAPPLPRRHFCNSMQASELCHKVLVSLKAEPSSKVGAGSMGSALRLRSEGFL